MQVGVPQHHVQLGHDADQRARIVDHRAGRRCRCVHINRAISGTVASRCTLITSRVITSATLNVALLADRASSAARRRLRHYTCQPVGPGSRDRLRAAAAGPVVRPRQSLDARVVAIGCRARPRDEGSGSVRTYADIQREGQLAKKPDPP